MERKQKTEERRRRRNEEGGKVKRQWEKEKERFLHIKKLESCPLLHI